MSISRIAPPNLLGDLSGWMVLGVVTQSGTPKPRSVPVLANSASAAIALAAEAHMDFQPVGVMSENELLGHLQAIELHRATYKIIN